jgi:signal peptidase I
MLSVLLTGGFGWLLTKGLRQYRTHHPYTVRNTSMTPTIYQGDEIEVDETAYKHRPPARGDLIAFRHNGTILVKRAIALGGDTIEDNKNTFRLNGVPLVEPYAHYDDTASLQKTEIIPPTLIPKDELFVMGDWRTRSLDSRRPVEFGVVHLGDVVGKVVGVSASEIPGQSGRTF